MCMHNKDKHKKYRVDIPILDDTKYWTCPRRHFTLKSNFLLVNFYFVLAQFQIKIDFFPWYFLHTYFFVHKLQYFFLKPFQQTTFLDYLEKSAHVLIRSLSTVFQVANNRLTSTMNNRFNICRKKYLFFNNHRNIELLFDWSTY